MSHSISEWRVPVDTEQTSTRHQRATDGHMGCRVVFVCAHGAGGHMSDSGMVRVADTLLARGIDVVRFNFLYREKHSGRPDPMPRLEQCIEAVVARTREELTPERLVIGGRSMGGRAASMMAARGFPCDGLLLLAYPLHPAGKPEQRRDKHLASITVPTLCFNGTRDPLCRRDLMDAALQRVGDNWRMHWLEGADHSFHCLKSSGRTDDDVYREMGETTRAWLGRILG